MKLQSISPLTGHFAVYWECGSTMLGYEGADASFSISFSVNVLSLFSVNVEEPVSNNRYLVWRDQVVG